MSWRTSSTRRLALEAPGLLVLAHALRLSAAAGRGRRSERYGAFAWTGISSVIWSRRAWASTETCLSSPRIQTRL